MTQVQAGTRVDAGSYVDVGGRTLWHFADGDPRGPATVLLHGAFSSVATFGAQIPAFVDVGLRLYAPERSGHGHSPDIPGPFTYDDLADTVIEYLEQVVGGPAHLVGWSDGALIATRVARRRPDLVNRLVLIGQYFSHDGHEGQGILDAMRRRDPDTMQLLRADYDAWSPDGPDHFAEVFDKVVAMLTGDQDDRLADLTLIGAPTLVVQGDRDLVRLEHSVAIVRALPRGRLAILPGTHIVPLESPDVFNPLVLSFLAADPPSECAS